MKYEREVMFRCDHCNKNITNKKHLRILLGSISGWMVPPFIGGKPEYSLADRKPEFHFDSPECFTTFFVEKLHAIRTDTRRNEVEDSISSISRKMLEEFGTPRPHLLGKNDLRACNSLQGKEGERDLGNRSSLLVESSRGGDEERNKRVDSIKQNDEKRREKVSTFRLGAEKVLSKFYLWKTS